MKHPMKYPSKNSRSIHSSGGKSIFPGDTGDGDDSKAPEVEGLELANQIRRKSQATKTPDAGYDANSFKRALKP